jgi:hypothetical protein
MKKKKDIGLKPQVERVEKLFPSMEEPCKGNKNAHAFYALKLPNRSLIRELLKRQVDSKKRQRAISQLGSKNNGIYPRDTSYFSRQMEISPHRVRNWGIKAHALAAQKLKSLSIAQGRSSSSIHKFTLIDKSEEKLSAEREKNELWHDLLQQREERHFHLTRITKFLVD